ncbi:unnamed protein product [Rhizophagus irregularis]|uniref:Uncharacterized protein n=1 Tax=Rhizophagus irregularis TaxID=588596 RepID=A0A916ED16_9GLOM|nr:unnamed protein product [Rhizophagus irregularis]CAB5214549.1 unnamed protein product [Rhizophagus irregularis]CAB5378653.1 unnamed protein product [Rhizophagus irregularis]
MVDYQEAGGSFSYRFSVGFGQCPIQKLHSIGQLGGSGNLIKSGKNVKDKDALLMVVIPFLSTATSKMNYVSRPESVIIGYKYLLLK